MIRIPPNVSSQFRCPKKTGLLPSPRPGDPKQGPIHPKPFFNSGKPSRPKSGGSRIRTCEGMSQQIYSLSRLTASVSPRKKCCLSRPSGRQKASGGVRTHDLRFTKPLLCQLSYAGGDAKTSKYTETRSTRNTKKAPVRPKTRCPGSGLARRIPVYPDSSGCHFTTGVNPTLSITGVRLSTTRRPPATAPGCPAIARKHPLPTLLPDRAGLQRPSGRFSRAKDQTSFSGAASDVAPCSSHVDRATPCDGRTGSADRDRQTTCSQPVVARQPSLQCLPPRDGFQIFKKERSSKRQANRLRNIHLGRTP